MLAGYSDGKCTGWLLERWKRQDVKMLRWKLKRGIFVLIQNDSKKIKKLKGEAVWRRQGNRKRAREEKKRWRRCKMWRGNTDTFTHTHTLLLNNVFAHRRLYTQHFHTHVFTHKRLYTQTPLDTDTFYTHAHTHTFLRTYVFTPMLLHTDDLTQKTSTHRSPLHTDALTHKHLFAHRFVYTQTLLHAHAFLYTETL